jgi:hypothetical protein
VQLGAGEGQARAQRPPQLTQVDGGQPAAAVVEQALMGDLGGPGGHGLVQGQRPQGTHAVGGQVHAGPGHIPGSLSLDQLRGEPGLSQRSG